MPTKSTTKRPVGRPPVPLVSRICEHCDQPFFTKASYIKHGRCRYCSPACGYAAKIAQRPPEQRFWEQVNKTDTCWLWTGHTNKKGYGQIRIDHKSHTTHRYSWELTNGPIPAGMCVCHHCDVPLCCRPDHLFLGTKADNNIDRMNKGRSVVGEQHKHTFLTEAQVHEIRRLYASGECYKKIAEVFGISRNLVSDIVRRKTWKHI